jgi:hypothetical protein
MSVGSATSVGSTITAVGSTTTGSSTGASTSGTLAGWQPAKTKTSKNKLINIFRFIFPPMYVSNDLNIH